MIGKTGKKGLRKAGVAVPSKNLAGIGSADQLLVWVLYPQLISDDPNLQYYYDFTQSHAEYSRAFDELGIAWKWQPVTQENYVEVVAHIRQQSGRKVPVVFNLCDGDEVNGTPGISVIHELEKHRLIYTGSDAGFYAITTSKIPMKQAFDRAGITTPAWSLVTEQSLPGLVERLGAPLILKPAVSGGSMGVSIKNVVYTQAELEERFAEIKAGYRGWNLLADGLLAEAFINGPEFTSLVQGSNADNTRAFTPAERVFHASLPDEEKFLSFDRLWEIYEEEKAMPGEEDFYEYKEPEPGLQEAIKKISLDAYAAVNAVGYGRLDIRMDKQSGELFVLEINAQCGLSEDEDYTSIGAILRFSQTRFSSLVLDIIRDAFLRRGITLRIK